MYALLGDRANAIAWLKRAVELGNLNCPWFERDKNWDKLRDDPEYQKVLSEVRKCWQQYTAEFASD